MRKNLNTSILSFFSFLFLSASILSIALFLSDSLVFVAQKLQLSIAACSLRVIIHAQQITMTPTVLFFFPSLPLSFSSALNQNFLGEIDTQHNYLKSVKITTGQPKSPFPGPLAHARFLSSVLVEMPRTRTAGTVYIYIYLYIFNWTLEFLRNQSIKRRLAFGLELLKERAQGPPSFHPRERPYNHSLIYNVGLTARRRSFV